MAIAGRKSEGAQGYGPNGRGPHSQRGDNTTVWEKLLPTFDFSFRADSTVSLPCSPCSLLSVLAVASLFFPFLFFFFFFFFSFFPFHLNLSAATSLSPSPPPCLTLTQVISRQRHLNTTTTAPTPWPLQPPLCHPLQVCQPPAVSALTRVMGTHKPPHCHRPHYA